MKKEYTKIYIIIITAILIISLVCFFSFEKQDDNFFNAVDNNSIIFSENEGIYNKSLSLKLKKSINVPIGSSIYYTINGDDPTFESEKFNKKIYLELNSNINVYTIKAIFCLEEKCSNTINKTYILINDLGQNIGMDVININTNYYNLYDYNYGIFVKGFTYDNELASGKQGYINGNYNNRGDEWLRDGTLTYFDKDGTLIYKDDILFGISGNTSASSLMKSLKIKNKENKFILSNLNNNQEYSYNSLIYEYNSLKLRSNAQDWEASNIRDSLISRLVTDSNADFYISTSRALVYLNGNFLGIYNVDQNYSNSFLRIKYNLPSSGEIKKYSGSEAGVLTNFGVIDLFNNDLNIDENRIALEEKVDMDSFLLYYAINVLVNNNDWPQNNFVAWNYVGNQVDNNKYTDQKIRFLGNDYDVIYYTENNKSFFEGCDSDTFENLMEGKYRAFNSVFSNVMKSNYYKDKFVTIITDLQKTSFSKENIYKIIDEEYSKISNANKYIISEEYEINSQVYVSYIKDAVIQKEIDLNNDFKKYFNLKNKYNFSIKVDNGLNVYFGNTQLYGNDTYNNSYYINVDFDVHIETYPGYEFVYAIINGEKYYDTEIHINDSLIKNNEINIEVKSIKKNEELLLITEVSAKSDSDWFKITNAGNNNVNLKKYYVSDNENKIKKYKLPDITLLPGESIIINGKKNYFSLGDYICNFNLTDEETLYLFDSSQEIIVDKILIPKMEKYESYGRYLNSNKFVYYDNYSNQRKK